MKTITMLEFRRESEKILAQVEKGQRMILTRRGKPVARLEPFTSQEEYDVNDPFLRLAELAGDGGSITNEEIDKILYGE